MLSVRATIVLRGPERGGLAITPDSGIRPSFNYAGQLVACEVRSDGDVPLPLEQSQEVTVELPYGDQVPWNIQPGVRFQLNVASQVIGDGTVLFVNQP